MSAVAAPTLARSLGRERRRSELTLGLLVVAVTVGGYLLVTLANGPKLPPDLYPLLAWVFVLYLVAHLAVRRFAPNADGTLLPLVAMLNGIGFVFIARLADVRKDYAAQARIQSLWVAIGVGVFVLTLVFVRDIRIFERYKYTALLLGLLFLLLPLAPAIGEARGGGRLWVRFGTLSFEPSEIAKVLLVAFFAAYLVEKRELLSHGRIRIGRWFVPSLRDLGPLLLAWGMALLVLAYEKDIGTSLLFFGVFAAMLYMSTRRMLYLVGTLVLLVIGAYFAYKTFGHVRVRIENWTNPWRDPHNQGLQPIQGWFGFASGGIAGTGIGLGHPGAVPDATTDFMLSTIGEELGLVGVMAIIISFMLLVGSAFRIAIDAARPFAKLFAAGIGTIIGLQSFLIIGGVLRLIPLTGIALPFVSYGGSALIANFVLIALLLRISDENAETIGGGRRTRSDRMGAERRVNAGVAR
jgi:cell division protein FtsW (lipid II flippase)